MLAILLHSSKTMRPFDANNLPYQRPQLLSNAEELAQYIKTLSEQRLVTAMKLSPKKAAETHALFQSWTTDRTLQRPAIDAFLGDIYSGLQVSTFSERDRTYANDHLLILSGLYGALRALDSIFPYRLEMGYKLPKKQFGNLYAYWGTQIANLVSNDAVIINLSAAEYTKAVLQHLPNTTRIITPKFLTMNSKTNKPEFVTVHAKIARGAFAHWLITQQIEEVSKLSDFSELNYVYDIAASSPTEPVFVCQEFGGLGLSVRLT